jgi:hypothetical protein
VCTDLRTDAIFGRTGGAGRETSSAFILKTSIHHTKNRKYIKKQSVTEHHAALAHRMTPFDRLQKSRTNPPLKTPRKSKTGNCG